MNFFPFASYSVNHHEQRRFDTCDGSRCTLYLNTGLDVIDYFDIDAVYVGGCSLYVSQQFMYYKLTGASDNEWYRDTGVIHLQIAMCGGCMFVVEVSQISF